MKRIASLLTAAVIAASPALSAPLFSSSAEFGGFVSAGSFYDMGYDFQPGLWLLTVNKPGTQEQRGYLVLNEDDSGKVIEPYSGESYRIILSRQGDVANLRYEGQGETYFYDVTDKGDKNYELKLRDDNITLTMKLLDPEEREKTLIFHTLADLSNLALQDYKYSKKGEDSVSIHSYVNDDGKAVVQLCDDNEEHMVVVEAYSLDPRDCTGSDLLGNFVDIRTVCADNSVLRPGIWLAESDGNKYAPTYYYFYGNSAEGTMVDQHTGKSTSFMYTLDNNKLTINADDEYLSGAYDVQKLSDFVFYADDEDGSQQTFSYIGYHFNGQKKIYSDAEIADMVKDLCIDVTGYEPSNVDVVMTDTGFVKADAYDIIDGKVSPLGHLSVDRYSGKGYADDGTVVQLSDYLCYPDVIRPGVWQTVDTLNTSFKAGYLVIEQNNSGYQINGAGGTVKPFTWVRTGNTCCFKDGETGEEIEMYIYDRGNGMTLSYVGGGGDFVKLRYLDNITYRNFNFHGVDELTYFADEYYKSVTGYQGEVFNTLDHTDDHFFTVDIIVDNKIADTYYIDKFSGLAKLKDGTLINVLEKPKAASVVKTGDVNNDGLIDSSDASEVLSIYADASTGGTAEADASKKAAADLNQDGLVDSNDASLILLYYAYVSTSSGDDIKTPEEFIKSMT